jgi:tetratricopeptide (TPR) repeat protein
MEGNTHALANRPAEAEMSFRKALARSGGQPRPEVAGLLGALGETLGDQCRFDEAAKCLEGSIRLGDSVIGSARIDLAELLLKQGAEPARALQLIEEARRIAKGPVAAKVAPMRSGLCAWALALLGRSREADEAIARAMEVRREPYAAMFASTRWYAAMALVAMDRKEKAIEEFRTASAADPRGKYGALALQQLHELGA